jgi:hypothetical protein
MTILNLTFIIQMREEIRANMDTLLEMKSLHKADPYGLQTTWGAAAAQRNILKERDDQQVKVRRGFL